MSHEERMQLQKDVQLMKNETLEKCVPSLPLKGNKYSHFYNDKEKFRTVFNELYFASDLRSEFTAKTDQRLSSNKDR